MSESWPWVKQTSREDIIELLRKQKLTRNKSIKNQIDLLTELDKNEQEMLGEYAIDTRSREHSRDEEKQKPDLMYHVNYKK